MANNSNTTKEDAEMKKLMDKWEITSDGSSLSSSHDHDDLLDYDDLLEKFRRTVTITDHDIDQIILGTSDLDAAVAKFEQQMGVASPNTVTWVASLNGTGTKSARMAFESCCFLEIVGPDPKQETVSSTPLKEALSKIAKDKIVPLHYAFRSKDAEQIVQNSGYGYNKITMVAKDKGMPWTWDQYFLEDHDEGGLVPFVTNWKESFHVSGKLPILGKLESVKVSAPADSKIHKLLDNVNGIQVETGSRNLEFTFSSPTGSHTFSCTDPIGITFPDDGGLPVKTPS